MRQAISRPPSKPVHPRDVDHADPDEYRGERGPCKRDHGSGRPSFTRAFAYRRAMLNEMRLPHGMDLASLGARLRVPLHGYVLSLLALRSEAHTSELQSLMRTPYAVLSWK